MTKISSADVGFYLLGGYDVLGYQTTLTVLKKKLRENTMVMGESWEKSELVNLQQAHIEQDGFYDDATNGNNDALLANVGTAVVLCLGHEGNTIGQRFIGFSGVLEADYERAMSIGAFHKAKATHEGVGVVEEGKILHRYYEETAASGNTEASYVDDGAASAAGGSGYLQVPYLNLGGYTSVTFKVRHSTDHITFADLITFTVVTAGLASERKTVAGTVYRYLAMSWLFNGTGTGQTFTGMVGFYRN